MVTNRSADLALLALLLAFALPSVVGAQAPDEREYLVPELAHDPFRISPGPRRLEHSASLGPGIGKLGDQSLYSLRLGYSPNDWLGYEISLGHNPTAATHAVFHTVNAVFRYPLPGRLHPFADLGFGMMTVFAGEAIGADPVTRNALAVGGGLEFLVRNDLAVCGLLRHTTIVGSRRDGLGSVAYEYREVSIGLKFYRHLGLR